MGEESHTSTALVNQVWKAEEGRSLLILKTAKRRFTFVVIRFVSHHLLLRVFENSSKARFSFNPSPHKNIVLLRKMSNFEAKAASERKAQEGEEKIMNEIISNIRSDLPKIDVSIKNLLSVILGKSQLDAGSSKVDSISSHYLMDYAKLFLSCLQNTTLLDVMEYCAAFPQVESQSASDRLDEVCRYKAYFAYREHAVSSGQKVSKFFGRGYFIETKVWPRIKSIFLERLESGEFPKLTVGEGRQFLDLYEKSIFQSGKSGRGNGACDLT